MNTSLVVLHPRIFFLYFDESSVAFVIIHTAKSPKMHLAEIFLLSSKCWQSLIIKIVVVAIVCQNIPWRCRERESYCFWPDAPLRDHLSSQTMEGIAEPSRSSRGKVGRKRENMHNAIIIVDNALSIAREMTSMTTYHNSSSKIQKAIFFLQWLKTAQKVSFLQTFRAKTRIDYLFQDCFLS